MNDISSLFSIIRYTLFDQSTSVHLVSESRGGTLSVTEEGNSGVQYRIINFMFTHISLFLGIFSKFGITSYLFV